MIDKEIQKLANLSILKLDMSPYSLPSRLVPRQKVPSALPERIQT